MMPSLHQHVQENYAAKLFALVRKLAMSNLGHIQAARYIHLIQIKEWHKTHVLFLQSHRIR